MTTHVDLHPERILSLCSGSGGLDLGVRLALPTARTVCYVEREAYACEVLVRRMSEGHLDDAPIWTDLATFQGRPWRGVVEGVTGGYPCQPFSVVGKQRGVNDPRHLWPHIRRIVDDIQPQWCFFENVANHLRLGFRDVADDLRQLGYRVAASLWTASEIGAPHRRERLFILAMADSDRGRQSLLGTRYDDDGGDASGCVSDGRRAGVRLADGWGERSQGISEAWATAPSTGRGRGAGIPVWPPLPGDVAGWGRILADRPDLAPALSPTAEREICGVADGYTARVDELRLLGNGVVPAQAAAAFVELADALLGS